MAKKEIDMINGPLAGKILMFAVPLMGSSILQLLFNAADVIVVGKFAGDNSMGAVGATTSLINLIVSLFIGLSVGANVAVAKALGQGDRIKIHNAVHTSILLSFISGIFLLIFGVALSGPILELMNTPPEVIELSKVYLRIYFCGMPFSMLYNFGSAILRAKGDTKRPLIYLTIAGITNVVLNCISVIWLRMDVAGVAIATVVSQVISSILIIRCLCRETNEVRVNLKELKIDRQAFGQIAKIGLPAGLQGILFSLSNVIIQSSINSFGDIVVSGNTAAINLGDFIYVTMNAFHQAGLSFNGQNMGAGKYNRVDKVTALSLGYATVIGSVLCFLLYIFGPTLLGIYSDTPAVIEAGMVRITYCIAFYWLCGMMDVMPGCIRGMGYSMLPMIVTLLGSCAFRILWVKFIFPQYGNIENLFLSYPVSWVLTFSAHVVCYFILRKQIRKKARLAAMGDRLEFNS